MNTNCKKYINGKWVDVIPLPFYWGLFPFIYKRITGWRDEYGRKAMFIGFK